MRDLFFLAAKKLRDDADEIDAMRDPRLDNLSIALNYRTAAAVIEALLPAAGPEAPPGPWREEGLVVPPAVNYRSSNLG